MAKNTEKKDEKTVEKKKKGGRGRPKSKKVGKGDLGSILKLEREDLLEAELKVARIDALTNSIALKAIKADKVEHDAILKARGIREEARRENNTLEETRDELKRFFNGLSDKYGVDFRKVTYDSNTGIITVVEETEPPKGGGE